MDLDTETLIQRGRDAFERRQYDVALAAFREVLEANPGFADIRHMTGLCLSFLGEPEQALEEFDRALSINDEYAEAHLHRGIALSELGRFDEAQAAFTEAARLESEPGVRFPRVVSARLANAHMELGDLYLAAGGLEEAADQYRRAIRLRPGFLDIRQKLGHVLIGLGSLHEAELELEAVLAGNPRFLAARLNLGLVYFRRGELERAAQEWQTCREQNPDHPQVKAFLALLEKPASGEGSESEGEG